MEKNLNEIFDYTIDQDILVAYELAANFGEDIPLAYGRLCDKLSQIDNSRRCFGLITHVSGKMLYLACLEIHSPEEAKSNELSTTIIPKGEYKALKLENWADNLTQIGPTFDRLIYSGLVDKNAPGIEYYITNHELICMMKKLD